MIKLHISNKSQVDESNDNCKISRKKIKFDSNNISFNYDKVRITKSLSQGAEKDKKQSYDWNNTSKIIVVILKVIKQLLIIAPPLFNLLC